MKLGLGRRGLPLVGAGFLVLLALGGAIFWLVGETSLYAAATTTALQQRVVTNRLLLALQDAETGQRGFLLTRDPSYLEPYDEARRDLPEFLAQLAPALGDAAAVFQTTVTAKLDELERTVALVRAGDIPTALRIVRTGEGKALMDSARVTLEALDTREAASLANAQRRLAESGHTLKYGAIAAIGTVLLLSVVVLGLARRNAAALVAAADAVRAANDALEERVAERTADLAEANEEVQRFATVVTHDLRAPLVNVMGFTAELEGALPPLRALLESAAMPDPAARAALDTDIPEALGFIRSATSRMDRLINAILKLSREGRRVLRPEPIAMTSMVEALAGSLSYQASQATAEITVAPDLPDLVSDRLAIEQVFGNLLDNAVKYLVPDRPGRITVRGRDRGRYLVYEIADNGRGIEARDLTRIFEPFRRAGRQDRPGDGIGLAHVRALARRLGGTVTCDSSPGEGSVFRVNMPRRPPGAVTENASAAGLAALERVA